MYLMLLKRFISTAWSVVNGHCVKLSPANTTKPMLSFGRPAMNSVATFFAASNRFGRRSSASIVPEMSRAIIMSIPSVFSLRKLFDNCGRETTIIKHVRVIILKKKGKCLNMMNDFR